MGRLAPGARRALALAAAALAVAAALGAWLALRTPSRYFPASEVDRVARPLADIGLAFPGGGTPGIDYYGTLRLEVFIDEAGTVDRVEVLESTVPDAFREQAVGAFGHARFAPALRRGRPVKSVKKVEVRFEAPVRGLDRGP